MGSPDDLKLRACAILCDRAEGGEAFAELLRLLARAQPSKT